ncbi:MAG: L-ectoine synthase [Methanothrix sp.]|jgi:L-ectoine synthase|nr:MAG: L-ectoine synthase [Methanothrix sp.]
MIVRNLRDAERSERRVVAKNWESIRLLLKDDDMGFSFHITTIYPGTETCIWYKNHLESVYCIEGEGEVVVLDGRDGGGKVELLHGTEVDGEAVVLGGGVGGSGGGAYSDPGTDGGAEPGLNGGKIYKISPGTLYILDRHDRHLLRAKTALKLACVFNPPLVGDEVHDEDGVYPLAGD